MNQDTFERGDGKVVCPLRHMREATCLWPASPASTSATRLDSCKPTGPTEAASPGSPASPTQEGCPGPAQGLLHPEEQGQGQGMLTGHGFYFECKLQQGTVLLGPYLG